MKRLALLLVGIFVLASSCAATLKVKGTAPSQLNDGTCTTPVLSPGSSVLILHAQVVGKGIEDSISVAPGTAFAFSWTIPAGSYQVRGWASIAGNPALVGCDTTITVQALAPPWRISFQ